MMLKRESKIPRQRNGKSMLYPQYMREKQEGSPDSRKRKTQTRSAPAKGIRRR